MPRRDDGFGPPPACIQWCRHRNFDLHVLDDGVEIDLDWWNTHLDRAGHDLRLRARGLDGQIVTGGYGTVQRNDLRFGSDLAEGEHDSLGLLFLCAAWQGSHRHRRAVRRFPDVLNPHLSDPHENPVAKTLAVLDSCVRNRVVPEDLTHSWSAWPDAPGVGVSLMATFLWAVKASVHGGPAQLVDQFGVSTLIHEGWLEDPSVTGFTRRRYDRYVELITRWAADIGTSSELVEMWLVRRWSARVNEARHGQYTAPTLF